MGTVTIPGDSTTPPAPSNVSADIGPGRQVVVNWDQLTKAQAPDLKEYRVYRSTTNDFGTAALQKTVEGGEFKQGFQTLTAGATYYYWVTAVDRSDNESSESLSVSITPQDVDTNEIKDGAVTSRTQRTIGSFTALTPNTWETVATESITGTGTEYLIFGNFTGEVRKTNDSDASILDVRIAVINNTDSTASYQDMRMGNAVFGSSPTSYTCACTVSLTSVLNKGDSYDIELQAQWVATNSGGAEDDGEITKAILTLLETKR